MMIDYHTHILPAMDDGAANSEESYAMLRLLDAQGAKAVMLTPHFYGDREDPKSFFARREHCFAQLSQRLKGETQIPQLSLGAEVAYFPGLSQCQALADFTLEQTNLLLIEMPFFPWSSLHTEEILRIARMGFVPALAHVNRYLDFVSDRVLLRLAEEEVLFQFNAETFEDARSGKRVMHLLDRGVPFLFGSDCHNLTTRRPNLDRIPRDLMELMQEDD